MGLPGVNRTPFSLEFDRDWFRSWPRVSYGNPKRPLLLKVRGQQIVVDSNHEAFEYFVSEENKIQYRYLFTLIL